MQVPHVPQDTNVNRNFSDLNVLNVFGRKPQSAENNSTAAKMPLPATAAKEQATKPFISKDMQAKALVMAGNIAIGVGAAGSIALLPLTLTGGALGLMAAGVAKKLGVMKGNEDKFTAAGIIIGSLGTAGIALGGKWLRTKGKNMQETSQAQKNSNASSLLSKRDTDSESSGSESVHFSSEEESSHSELIAAPKDPRIYQDYVPSDAQLKKNEELAQAGKEASKVKQEFQNKELDRLVQTDTKQKITELKDEIFHLEGDVGNAKSAFELHKAKHDTLAEGFNNEAIQLIVKSRPDDAPFNKRVSDYYAAPDKEKYISGLPIHQRSDINAIHTLELENIAKSEQVNKPQFQGSMQLPSIKEKYINAGVALYEAEKKLEVAKAKLEALIPPQELIESLQSQIKPIDERLDFLNNRRDEISATPNNRFEKYEGDYNASNLKLAGKDFSVVRDITAQLVTDTNAGLQRQMGNEIQTLNFQKDVLIAKRDVASAQVETTNLLKNIQSLKSQPDYAASIKPGLESQLDKLERLNNKSINEEFKSEYTTKLNTLKESLKTELESLKTQVTAKPEEVQQAPKATLEETKPESSIKESAAEAAIKPQPTLEELKAIDEKELTRLQNEPKSKINDQAIKDLQENIVSLNTQIQKKELDDVFKMIDGL
jgi:hypothetical protein